MGKDSAYYQEKTKKQLETIERLLSELPSLVREMVDFKRQFVANTTLISYCYDLRIFFRWWLKQPECAVSDMQEISYRTIESIPVKKFEDFAKWLECSNDPDDWHEETKKGIHRKFATIHNLYKYHYRVKNIKFNPAEMVMLPKFTKDKAIVTLTEKEILDLLKAFSTQKCFRRGRMRTYKKMSRQRDMAIFVLLLNTGIRVGECAGLDFTDVDLNECSLAIVRKGGAADKVFFNKNVRDILKAYVKGERKELVAKKVKDGNEHQAFFYSIWGKRLTADSIERMIKAYTMRVVPHKHITPHKLRSTYGTALYKATGDIRLVGEVLGHENINTTIRYYAAFDDEKKRQAAKAVDFTKKAKLGEDKDENTTGDSFKTDSPSASIKDINATVEVMMDKEKEREKEESKIITFSERGKKK